MRSRTSRGRSTWDDCQRDDVAWSLMVLEVVKMKVIRWRGYTQRQKRVIICLVVRLSKWYYLSRAGGGQIRRIKKEKVTNPVQKLLPLVISKHLMRPPSILLAGQHHLTRTISHLLWRFLFDCNQPCFTAFLTRPPSLTPHPVLFEISVTVFAF